MDPWRDDGVAGERADRSSRRRGAGRSEVRPRVPDHRDVHVRRRVGSGGTQSL